MEFRDRIKELRRVPAGQLKPNPRNWRKHPAQQQAALRAVLSEVGFADALLARELDDGSLELIDGHLRALTAPEALVPVLVLDVTQEEADKILATHDPLAAMAETDDEMLAELVADMEIDHQELQSMMDDLLAESSQFPIQGHGGALRQLETDTPPVMTWALIGVETVRFAEIAARIEELSQIEGVTCEITSNNG